VHAAAAVERNVPRERDQQQRERPHAGHASRGV
jgi:hypothetical protein